MFLLELELGDETFICKDLSLNRLPESFHFYDGILNFIKENISREKLVFYNLKSTLRDKLESNVRQVILDKFCASSDKYELTLKPQVTNAKSRNEIDYRTSPHTDALQMS